MEVRGRYKLIRFGRLSFWVLIGVVAVLNVQPWIGVAKYMVDVITLIPFQNFLLALPLIGSVLKFLLDNLTSLFAIALWSGTQFLQVLPIIYADSDRIHQDIERAKNGEYALDGSKSDSLKRFKNKALYRIKNNIETLCVLSYLFEAIVCFIAYPAYANGNTVLFIKHFMNWKPQLFDLHQVAMFLVTMLSFEVLWRVLSTLRDLDTKPEGTTTTSRRTTPPPPRGHREEKRID